MVESIKKGFMKGINLTIKLSKIIIPVYIFVTILKYTPVIDFFADICRPLLNVIGLSGEAALVLVLGNLINIYAGLGALAAFSFSAKEITIITMMLAISHSLIMESAVIKQLGGNFIKTVLFRISTSIACGIIINFLL